MSEANQAVTTRVLYTKTDRKSSVEIEMNPHPAHSKLYSEELMPDVFSSDENKRLTKVLNQLTHGGLMPTLFLNGIIALSGLPWKS